MEGGSNFAENVAQGAYDGTATVGRITSYFWFFILGGISLLMIWGGYNMYSAKPDPNLVRVNATVTKATCQTSIVTEIRNNRSVQHNNTICQLMLKFTTLTGETIVDVPFEVHTTKREGDVIDIYYRADNPKIVTGYSDPKSSGLFIMGIGAVIFAGAGLNAYLAKKSKLYSSAQGTRALVDVFW